MQIINLSAEHLGKLYSWLPRGLDADTVVFLPDACPGKSPLPTGTAVLTRQADWRRYAISDCGCGMRLLRSRVPASALSRSNWDELADRLRANKGQLGDLGGGNHFLDALAPYEGDELHFLVHTGSRNESGHVDDLVGRPAAFDEEFNRVVEWAAANRAAIQREIESVFGPQELILDLPHNTYEVRPGGGAIIRKGSVYVQPGDLCVIPSHMSGDVALVKATERVNEILNSLSHGTGRTMSRAECKPLADRYDFEALRQNVVLPTSLQDAALRTEGPYAYRDLDECLALIENYVEVVARYRVVGYMGHL